MHVEVRQRNAEVGQPEAERHVGRTGQHRGRGGGAWLSTVNVSGCVAGVKPLSAVRPSE